MRIPQNKRGLIVNKEYSRLPYMTDEGYDEIQRSTSQKFVQDNYGKFDESENQQPYKNDSEYDTDYQGLEYDYSLPGFDFNLGDLDIDPSSTTSKDIKCDAYWNQLFPGHPTGSGPFIPDSGDLSALNIYAKKCPVEFKFHICCGRGLKVQGPVNGEMESGQNYKFSIGNKPIDCEYDFWAKKGSMKIDGDYTAPQTDVEIEDTMGLEPWTGISGKYSKDCLTWKVKIKPKTCTGSIGYTTLQMQVSGTQTLIVVNPTSGETYYWAASSGSIDATGLSVTYTAPSSNANCTNNPTITLTCGGSTIGTLTIAVRANSFDSNKAAYYVTQGGGPGTPIGDPTNPSFILRDCEYGIYLVPVRCDGSTPRMWDMPMCGHDYANPYTGSCPHCAVLKHDQDPPGCWGNWTFDRVTDMAYAEIMCASAGSKSTTSPRYSNLPCNCAIGSVYDVRDATQIASGCCPAGLL